MVAQIAVKPKEPSRLLEVGTSQLDGYADELGARAAGENTGADDLRLYETYQSAFQRVMADVCLAETLPGMQKSVGMINDEDILSNFVSWEHSLRTTFTDTCDSHPAELVGQWELIDIAGEGSLGPILARDSASVMDDFGVSRTAGLQVKFGPAGELEVEAREDGSLTMVTGVGWAFRPGPAHLDTCEFIIRSGSSGRSKASREMAETRIRYTGFIDRGQRIESRFSQRPVRMTGRVEVASAYGDVKASGRFIMLLHREGK
jgi:hypothetical protein